MLAIRKNIVHFVYILILIAIFLEGSRSEIVIIHRLKNATVFNTTNDIEIIKRFRDFKQSLLGPEKARLSLSEPLDACGNLKKQSLISTNFHSSDESSAAKSSKLEIQWVALITGGGGCDLKTKVTHAAEAGYARVIVKITHPDDVYGHGDLHHDKDIQIDISLLNPADWDTIQKYVHPKPYVILLPLGPVSFVSWAAARFYDFFNVVSKFNDDVMMKVTGIGTTIFRLVKELLSFLIPALLLLGPAVFLIFIGMKNKGREDYEPPPRTNYRFYNFQNDRDNFYWNDEDTPPTPPPQKNDIDKKMKEYKEALKLSLDKPLTKQNIKSAYKRQALIYHPDKNREKKGERLQAATKQFCLIKEARDELLKQVNS